MKGAAAYPSYKNSGSEWLGNIPTHWDVKRGAAFLLEKRRKNDPLVSENYLSLMANRGIIPYAEKGDVGNKKPDDLTKCKLVSSGDFVINSMNYAIGSYGVSNYDGICSPVYVVMSHNPKVVTPEYVDLILSNSSYQKYAQSFGTGILDHRRAIGWDEIKKIPVAIPPIKEQVEIASHIRGKTTRIDSLIEKKTRFIELLKEKRQAVITNAVTKGLDPSVPMKDSGVKFIGNIPAHWKYPPFKQAAWFQEGPGIMAEDFKDTGIPLLRISGVQTQHATLDGCNFLSPDKVSSKWKHFRLDLGDLLISASATMGTISEVTENTVGSIAYTGIIRLKASKNTSKEYLSLFLVSDIFLEQINHFKSGSTIQHFGPTHLSRMKITFPPLDEQIDIASHTYASINSIDRLIDKSKISIELLKEHRSALITAAVTGKIDVRISK